MKNLLKFCTFFFLLASTQHMQSYTFKFTNKTPYTFDLILNKAISGWLCRNPDVRNSFKPNQSYTFDTGACCLQSVAINDPDRGYFEAYSGDSLPTSGANILCWINSSYDITFENGKYKITLL